MAAPNRGLFCKSFHAAQLVYVIVHTWICRHELHSGKLKETEPHSGLGFKVLKSNYFGSDKINLFTALLLEYV